MKIDSHLPKIQCPVYGVLKAYSLSIADKEDSTELKYVLVGVWNDSYDAKEVTVHGIYVSSETPEFITILYTENGGDGIMHITRANNIKPIQQEYAEQTDDDTLRALHHAGLLFIRQPKSRTFRFLAEGLSRVIRGTASYIVYTVQKMDGKLWFKVANVDKPTEMFDISATKVNVGAWHCEKGKRCPVPGPAPEDA